MPGWDRGTIDPGLLTRWPEPTGALPVGAISFDVTDERRAASYASPPAMERRLKVMAWYPAAVRTGEARPYFDEPELAELVSIFPILGLDASTATFADLRTASTPGAPALEGRHPLLVFCHGGMCYPQQNTLLFEDLASHGYVVLSVGHPNESGTHALADGTVLRQSPRILSESADLVITPDHLSIYLGTRPLAERIRAAARQVETLRGSWLGDLAHDWVRDSLFVVDLVERNSLPAAGAAVGSTCDLDRLGYFGMSYGGHVSALSCLADPRARAGVNLDGGIFTGEVLGRELGVPFLALSSDAALQASDFGVEGVAPARADGPTATDVMYEQPGREPRAPVHRISVRGAKHQDFTDFCWLFGNAEERPATLGPIGDRMIDVQRRVTRAFFDHYLRGTSEPFPGVLQPDLGDILVVQDRQRFLASASAP